MAALFELGLGYLYKLISVFEFLFCFLNMT